MSDQDPREIALDMLMELWERADDGASRDEISHVRHLLDEWLDEEPEGWMIG